MECKDFTAPACNGYEDILTQPSRMVMDVSYWLNRLAMDRLHGRRGELVTVMTSIEESTVGNRKNGLLVHDAFVRDHITEKDYLIVSMGGNDVALAPSLCTIISMLTLVLSPDWLIKTNWVCGVIY